MSQDTREGAQGAFGGVAVSQPPIADPNDDRTAFSIVMLLDVSQDHENPNLQGFLTWIREKRPLFYFYSGIEGAAQCFSLTPELYPMVVDASRAERMGRLRVMDVAGYDVVPIGDVDPGLFPFNLRRILSDQPQRPDTPVTILHLHEFGGMPHDCALHRYRLQ
ncbi:MAG: hypothetical protein H6865_05790 [Rhodospirillales bacterium]|nr:hypothetical protein [Alphaproteobacteria bacterium]MCB9987133.1 hypothetical protein [Rhodospirillales bacterium]USO08109.1 MAG: hypothetical protein H6866_02505 [Rhodospirillales bacterium]